MTSYDVAALPDEIVGFLTERHLASLTTVRRDGTPHATAIAFTYDAPTAVARVITSDGNQKVRNVERADDAGAPVVLCQVEGRRWLSLEGRARVERDPALVRDAEERYARRYRVPRENPRRVVLVVTVERVLGHY